MVDNHRFGRSCFASSLYNYFKKGANCAEKREKTDGVRKTEMLYFKVKIGSISLEKHTHPLQIDSFTDKK